jgi:3-deoxy-D-manno-octulosonate 8-phosphate phosphatase (KDO 8-P phosphatase)
MGDDVNDLPLLARVGLSACPADARPEVRAAVHLVTSAPGGRGAVRELCDLILHAKGL